MATVTTMDHPTRLKGPSDSRQRPVVDAIPKDDVELRLEKALFGDDLGFLDSLKKRVSDEDHALIRHMSQDSEASGNEEDEGLSDIPDENVWNPTMNVYHDQSDQSFSSSLSIPIPLLSQPLSHENLNRLPPSSMIQKQRRLGMTVMMTASPCPLLPTHV